MSIKIALDAGHGLYTAGKQTPDGIKEWTLNDKVCDLITEQLKDYDVSIIRTDNNEGKVDESLASRVNTYVNYGVSAFVSIHHNAYTGKWNNATGVEVYTDKNPTKSDKKLANLIYNRLVQYTGLKGRGVKSENFWVINQNKIPAVLCEGGFMDGISDYKIITSEAGQNGYAKAVAEGLIEFLSLKKKTTGTASSSSSKAVYFKKYTGSTVSIVTALNSIGAASSFAYRKKIAAKNNIKLYTGTAEQNTQMLNLLKQGKLIKP